MITKLRKHHYRALQRAATLCFQSMSQRDFGTQAENLALEEALGFLETTYGEIVTCQQKLEEFISEAPNSYTATGTMPPAGISTTRKKISTGRS